MICTKRRWYNSAMSSCYASLGDLVLVRKSMWQNAYLHPQLWADWSIGIIIGVLSIDRFVVLIDSVPKEVVSESLEVISGHSSWNEFSHRIFINDDDYNPFETSTIVGGVL